MYMTLYVIQYYYCGVQTCATLAFHLSLPPSLPFSLSPSCLSPSPVAANIQKLVENPSTKRVVFPIVSHQLLSSTFAHSVHCSMSFSLPRPVHSPKTSGTIRTSLVMLNYQEVTQRHPRVCRSISVHQFIYFLCALLLCLCVTV